MNSLQLISKLKAKSTDINDFINELFASGYQLNQIDKDLLKKQVLELYELVGKLKTNELVQTEPATVAAPKTATEVKQPEVKVEPTIIEEPIVETKQAIILPEPEPEVIDEIVQPITIDEGFKSVLTIANEEEISLNQLADTVAEEITTHTESIEPADDDLPPVSEVVKPSKPIDLNIDKAVVNKRIQYTVMPPADKPAMKPAESMNERLAQLNKAQSIEPGIDNLKTAISLNKKIAFVNELFKENVVEYAKAIDNLNNASDRNDALRLFAELRMQHNWSPDNALMNELETLIKRRFNN